MNEIVGIRKVDYKSKTTGSQVTGVELHVLCPDDNRVVGTPVDKLWLSQRIIDDQGLSLEVGDKVQIYYDAYRHISKVEVL